MRIALGTRMLTPPITRNPKGGTVKRLAIIAVATAAFVLSAVPAFGDSTGAVAMSIEVAAPCVTISPASVTFPSKPFSPSPTSPVFSIANTEHGVTNCSAGGEQIFARGSNATGTSGASWTLADATSAIGVDKYALRLEGTSSEGWKGVVTLSLADQLVKALGAGSSLTFGAGLYMPTVESSGAGQTMSMSVTYTATL
jgi:hypothetical protein